MLLSRKHLTAHISAEGLMVGNRYNTSDQWTGISQVDTASDAEAHSQKTKRARENPTLSDSVFNKGKMAVRCWWAI